MSSTCSIWLGFQRLLLPLLWLGSEISRHRISRYSAARLYSDAFEQRLDVVHLPIIIWNDLVSKSKRDCNRIQGSDPAGCPGRDFARHILFSHRAGEEKARVDKGTMSTLPTIIFNYQHHALAGRLVYLKGDLYFVDRVRSQGGDHGGELQITIYRTSEIEDVQITEHQ